MTSRFGIFIESLIVVGIVAMIGFMSLVIHHEHDDLGQQLYNDLGSRR